MAGLFDVKTVGSFQPVKKPVTIQFSDINLLDKNGKKMDINAMMSSNGEEDYPSSNDFDASTARFFFEIRDKLDGLESLLLFLSVYAGWTHIEIAQIVGSSQYYVHFHLKAIRERLRNDPTCEKYWRQAVNLRNGCRKRRRVRKSKGV